MKTVFQIFWQVIGISMDSDPAAFFVNLFLFCYESKWIGQIKNIDHQCAGRFGHVYNFINHLSAMNDNKKYGNILNEIYPEEFELKK